MQEEGCSWLRTGEALSDDFNLVSIVIYIVVCLLSLCRLSIGHVLEVLISVFVAGRELLAGLQISSNRSNHI